ncbi:MAG: flavin reductase [Clostridia bacterium]|nr:flavin reductase [Clostridia bacterium]
MKITDNVIYVGVDDKKIDLFEGQYAVPNGMSYNSYVILDDKIAVLDTVDASFTHEWLDNVAGALEGRCPDYLIVHHMEPDHSANIANFLKVYPNAKIVATAKAFTMMDNFFGGIDNDKKITVADGSTLSLGKHQLTFIGAPMVHWPEVMFTYESTEKILFSADAFGKFGALDTDEEWDCEARRYYFGIVGKYGVQVQGALNKAVPREINTICPLHGPVLTGDLDHYISQYYIWSSYLPEDEGVVIAYTSIYGNTKKAVMALADKLRAKGAPKVVTIDLAREDWAESVEDAFRYSKLVLATTTYNSDIFPYMRQFIDHLTERGYKGRTVGFIENGSWAPTAAKIMRGILEGSKDITFLETTCSIRSAMNSENASQLDAMADELCKDYTPSNKNDLTALFKIGYGLYVVTCNDGKKDNGLIVNTVAQVSDSPKRISVTINKANYSHHVIKQSGKLNVNCLTTSAPFSVFEKFGFASGRSVDKFAGDSVLRSENGLVYLNEYVNSYMSLTVEQYVDLGSHGMFICTIDEAKVLNNDDTMTYSYYHANVKPKPKTEGKKGYVCKICGYVYEGDTLPEDFVCPLCKHPASDFEPIK